MAATFFPVRFSPALRSSLTTTHKRWMGSGPKPRRRFTPASCAEMVSELSKEERKTLMAMLDKRQEKEERKRLKNLAKESGTPSPTIMANGVALRPLNSQLVVLALHQAMPYVGFGFLDNFIMIIAGEYIELTLGTSLSIGTMTAAALGNTISDVFGMSSAYYVERWVSMLGFSPPPLTLEQMELPVSRYSGFIGRVAGLTLGCFLGMIPLLFIDDDEDENGRDKDNDK